MHESNLLRRLSLSTIPSVAVLAASVACSAPSSEQHDHLTQSIAGGEEVKAGAWPNVVWLDNGCTGVLVDRDVVVYAAHCGADATTVSLGDVLQVDIGTGGHAKVSSGASREFRVVECRTYPDWQFARGNDIAFCLLDAPAAAPHEVVWPAQGCAESAIMQDAQAVLVGYGQSDAQGAPGTKRSTGAPIRTIGTEIAIGDAQHGPCFGDSGGPAFVRIDDTNHASEWALLGILSSGIQGEACGVGYYSPISALLLWLEATVGRDLSPCFDADGKWSPSQRCTRPALDGAGLPVSEPEGIPSELCGSAFAAAVATPSPSCNISRPWQNHTAPSLIIALLATLRRMFRKPAGTARP